MIRFVTCLLLLCYTHLDAAGQSQKVLYFDKDWNETAKGNAKFYRIVNVDASGNLNGKIKDYYITGQLQWEGKFLSKNYSCPDPESCQFDGVCTWYYKNGRKSTEGTYRYGKLVGTVTNWDESGNVLS